MSEDVTTIKIGDKYYDSDSITDLSIAIMKDIKTIDDEISKYGIQMSIAKLAKSKLIEELQKELPKMKEVHQPITQNIEQ